MRSPKTTAPIPPRPGRPWALLLPALCLAASTATADTTQANAGHGAATKGRAEQAYRQQRADCEAGKTGQDLATCLKEAGAARAEARRGSLSAGQETQDLAANRLLRCQRLPPAQQPDCERLARGEGSASGSVAGGGVLKTLVTRSVAASGSAASAAPAPALPASR